MLKENSGVRQKKHRAICRKCEFLGVVNEEGLWRNCEEEKITGKEICRICTKRVWRIEHGLLVDRCQVWHHVICEEVEEEVYELLKKQHDTLMQCNPRVRQNLQ